VIGALVENRQIIRNVERIVEVRRAVDGDFVVTAGSTTMNTVMGRARRRGNYGERGVEIDTAELVEGNCCRQVAPSGGP
jgi:hypothetical protein